MSFSSYAAEVLDKVPPPWEPSALVPSLVVVVLVCALVWSSRTNVRIGGLALALVWAAWSLGTSEWFSDDVGPALQAELSAGEARKWFYVMVIEACAPMVLALGLVLVRRKGYDKPLY